MVGKTKPEALGSGPSRASQNARHKIRHLVWEDSMGSLERSWRLDRRTILKGSAAIAAVQFSK
jgi:hypothetical protein